MSDTDRIRYLIDTCSELSRQVVSARADLVELRTQLDRERAETTDLRLRLAEAIKDRDPFLPALEEVHS